MTDEFYVGYVPRQTAAQARFTRTAVTVAALLAAGLAWTLAAWRAPFDNSRFEFGVYRDYTGTLAAHPVPSLLAEGQRILLVAEGKHGANSLAARFDQRNVRIRGALIEHDGIRMLEILPSIEPLGGPVVAPREQDLGSVTLTGEIADSKCHLGVMNPGRGKVHRDCAVRCLSGGVPATFLARDETGARRILLLTGARPPLDHVAEPVTITGRLTRWDQLTTLRAESIEPVRE